MPIPGTGRVIIGPGKIFIRKIHVLENKKLYTVAGAEYAVDIVVNLWYKSAGKSGLTMHGVHSASDRYSLFQEGEFRGLYQPDFLNLVYMISMIPIYLVLMVDQYRGRSILPRSRILTRSIY